MDPKTNLGYLLHHLVFLLDRASDKILQRRLGIGFSQYKILMALKWHQGVQQRQIAYYLVQTEASISRQTKLMHTSGLIKTESNPRSRREHLTVLTAKGERVAAQATEILNTFHAPMFARLNAKQQAELRELLLVLHDFASSSKREK